MALPSRLNHGFAAVQYAKEEEKVHWKLNPEVIIYMYMKPYGRGRMKEYRPYH